MTAEILRYSRLSKREISFYQSNGYLMLPGLIALPSADALAQNVLQVMEGLAISREDLGKASSSKDKLRQSRQYMPDTPLAGLIHSQALKDIASQLMGGPSTLYLPFTAVKSGGGGGRFHFHQDNQYTRFDGPWHQYMVCADGNDAGKRLLTDRARNTLGRYLGVSGE